MTIRSYISSALLGIVMLIFTGCKEEGVDPKVEALNKQLAALKNEGSSWVLGTSGSVMKDDYDVTDQFTGFKLTIGDKTYTTQNSLSTAWQASGTWDFQGDDPTKLVRNDDVVVSVELVDNTLRLVFVGMGASPGARTNSISGTYEFQLVSE